MPIQSSQYSLVFPGHITFRTLTMGTFQDFWKLANLFIRNPETPRISAVVGQSQDLSRAYLGVGIETAGQKLANLVC